jgi:hypothetical protein
LLDVVRDLLRAPTISNERTTKKRISYIVEEGNTRNKSNTRNNNKAQENNKGPPQGVPPPGLFKCLSAASCLRR